MPNVLLHVRYILKMQRYAEARAEYTIGQITDNARLLYRDLRFQTQIWKLTTMLDEK